ncbi:MAG: hypothetical protein V7660_01085 [Hyphomonas sp.]
MARQSEVRDAGLCPHSVHPGGQRLRAAACSRGSKNCYEYGEGVRAAELAGPVRRVDHAGKRSAQAIFSTGPRKKGCATGKGQGCGSSVDGQRQKIVFQAVIDPGYQLGQIRFHDFLLEAAFPYHGYAPARCPERFDIPGISLDILAELLLPEFRTGCRGRGVSAASMTMPETSMHEDSDLSFSHHDVRATWKFSIMQAITIAMGVKRASQGQFRFGVLATNPGHHAGARFLVDDVSPN